MDSLVLKSIKSCEKFESKEGLDWARRIIVDYYTRTEEGWLLGCMVKVQSVSARQNPCQGGLSDSFLLNVEYKIGPEISREEWFVKVPKSLATVAMDQRELVMYNTIFPKLQEFLSERLYEDQDVDLPIPIIFASSFQGDGIHDFLVTENLRASNYFQVDNHTTKVSYMAAAMTSLANIHGITFSFMKSLGGKQKLLELFPTIKEQYLPECDSIRSTFNRTVTAYLEYLARIMPDIAQQSKVLSKFSKFLFKVFIDLENNSSLGNLMTLVHGDAKVDNFLFKKVKEKLEETYTTMLIDWQGCGFDLVSNDLMWCIYGFVKNLPETGDMIHGFVEYSVETYWDKLREVLAAFGDSYSDIQLPDKTADGVELVKEGFTLEFMKNALIRPVLSLHNRKALMRWWRKIEKGEDPQPPSLTTIFKSESYANFIFLYFKIATEINVFSHLAKSLLMQVKESLLNDIKVEVEEDSDSYSEDEDITINVCGKIDDNENVINKTEETKEYEKNEINSIVNNIIHEIIDCSLMEIDKNLPKTVTSLYGKVYVLNPSIKSL